MNRILGRQDAGSVTYSNKSSAYNDNRYSTLLRTTPLKRVEDLNEMGSGSIGKAKRDGNKGQPE